MLLQSKDLLYGLDEYITVQTNPKLFRAIYNYIHHKSTENRNAIADGVPYMLRTKTLATLDRLDNNDTDVDVLIDLFLTCHAVDAKFISNLRTAVKEFPEVNWRDGLSRFQMQSKVWAANILKSYDLGNVYLCGGWIGTLARVIFDVSKSTATITSFDIDDVANKASMILNLELASSGKYAAVNQDIYTLDYTVPDTVVNTICEHVPDFQRWLDMIPSGKLVLLQTNNMFEMTDHVNCVETLEEFKTQCQDVDIAYSNTISYAGWHRFMIVGVKR
jgi:hypothetical protein